MVNIDEQTRYAVEVVAESVKLTNQLLLFILRHAVEMLEGKDKDKILIDDSTKEGKQKINELMRKYKDGVEVLEGNLTKEQLKDYQKELKKLGVDFAVVKNGKDSYSFFFASQQANIIEKALKNVLERKNQVLNNEKVKQAEVELNAEQNKFSEKEIIKIKNIYDKVSDLSDETKKLNELNKLSPKDKVLFDKLKKLDSVIKEIQGYLDGNTLTDKESKVITNSKEESRKILRERLSQLDDKELAFFTQRMKYENLATLPTFNPELTNKEADNFLKMQKNFSAEQIQKIYNIDKDIRNLNNADDRSDNPKLTANEILKETNKFTQERQLSNFKKYSLENVKKIHLDINKDKDKDKDRGEERQFVKNKQLSL